MDEKNVFIENEQLREENQKIRSVINELIQVKQKQEESQIFENTKKRVFDWLKGLGIYAMILITVVGFTSYSQAKKELIKNFQSKSEPELLKHFEEEIVPGVEKKITDNANARMEGYIAEFEREYNQKLKSFASKNELKYADTSQEASRPENGWVYKKYLESQSNDLYLVSAYRLNVRKDANADAEILGRQVEGTKVRIIKEDGLWAHIEVVQK